MPTCQRCDCVPQTDTTMHVEGGHGATGRPWLLVPAAPGTLCFSGWQLRNGVRGCCPPLGAPRASQLSGGSLRPTSGSLELLRVTRQAVPGPPPAPHSPVLCAQACISDAHFSCHGSERDHKTHHAIPPPTGTRGAAARPQTGHTCHQKPYITPTGQPSSHGLRHRGQRHPQPRAP